MARIESSAPRPLRIREVAARLALSISSVRLYEREFGDYLSVPKTGGGHRRYREEDVKRLLHLRHLVVDEKLSFDQVREMVGGTPDLAPVRRDVDLLLQVYEGLTEEHLAIRRELREMREAIAKLDRKLDRFTRGGDPKKKKGWFA